MECRARFEIPRRGLPPSLRTLPLFKKKKGVWSEKEAVGVLGHLREGRTGRGQPFQKKRGDGRRGSCPAKDSEELGEGKLPPGEVGENIFSGVKETREFKKSGPGKAEKFEGQGT